MTDNTPKWADIDAGKFIIGNDQPHNPEDGEAPCRAVWLDAYKLSTTTITNAMFAAFVAETDFITLAETQGFSHVFQGQLAAPEQFQKAATIAPWWRIVEGASWRYPYGDERCDDNLPAVHIAYSDALAYCAWAKCRLPSEAEWERAAVQDEEVRPHIWRGVFPNQPETTPSPKPADDGPINALGLHHMCGNVWEWTMDKFTTLHSPRLTKNPKGPLNGNNIVVKGGSFLCCPSYCARFKPFSRRAEIPTATTSHLGFRVARWCK